MDEIIINNFKHTVSLCKSYFIWILIHYGCSHLYVYFCTPKTAVGFLTSPFLAITPQCKTCYWLLDSSRVSITNMWGIFTLWAIWTWLSK